MIEIQKTSSHDKKDKIDQCLIISCFEYFDILKCDRRFPIHNFLTLDFHSSVAENLYRPRFCPTIFLF